MKYPQIALFVALMLGFCACATTAPAVQSTTAFASHKQSQIAAMVHKERTERAIAAALSNGTRAEIHNVIWRVTSADKKHIEFGHDNDGSKSAFVTSRLLIKSMKTPAEWLPMTAAEMIRDRMCETKACSRIYIGDERDAFVFLREKDGGTEAWIVRGSKPGITIFARATGDMTAVTDSARFIADAMDLYEHGYGQAKVRGKKRQ